MNLGPPYPPPHVLPDWLGPRALLRETKAGSFSFCMENFFMNASYVYRKSECRAKGEMETTPARLVLEGKLGPGRK